MRGRFRVRLSPDTVPCTVIALTGAALAGIAVWLFCGTLRKEGPAGLPEASAGICALLAFAGLFLWIGGLQIVREIRTLLPQHRANLPHNRRLADCAGDSHGAGAEACL